ncbi:hypothetical protein BKA69DRAFT_266642 [Paraphysoderma sedebokerense]|nr:hypothetical protein BKA69DRAFT_266642 [Paraphysoderma sedebokerense]
MAGSTSTQTTQLNSSPDSSTDSSPNYSSRNSLSAKSSSEKLLDILGTELFKNILAKVNLYLRDPSLFAIRIIGIPGIFKSAFAEAACLKIIKDMSRAQTNEKDKGKEKEQETASTAELKKGEEKERDRVHNITRELSEIITRKELFRETSLSTSSESDKSQIVQVDGVLKKYFLMCEQDKHRLLFLICDDFNYVDPNFWHIARIKHWRPPNCVFVVTANWADVGIYHYPDNLVRRCLTIRMDDGDSDVIVRWGESQDWYEEDKFNSITFNGQGLNDVTAKEVVTYVKTIHERLRKELFRAVTGETKGSNQDPYNPTIGIGFHHFVFEHCQSTKDYVRNLNNRFFDLRLQLQDGCKIPDHLKTVLDEYETKLSEWNSTFEIDDNGDTIDLVHLKEKWEEWNNGPIGKNLRPRNMPCISVSQSSLPQSTRKRKRSLEKTSYPTPITTLASNDRQARDTVRPSAQPEDDLTSIANSSIRPIPATIDYFNFPSAASNGVNMQTTDQEQSTPDEFDQMIDDDDTETNGHSAISENYNTVEFGPVDTGNNMEEMPGDFFNLASEASNGVNIPTDPEQPTLDETDQIIDDDDTETNGDSAIDNNTAGEIRACRYNRDLG